MDLYETKRSKMEGPMMGAAAEDCSVSAKGNAAQAHLLERVHRNSFALMWRLKRDMDETFRALDLKPLEVLTLELLTRDAHYPKDLARALDAAPPVISALLRGLEARGLIARTLDPEDHRRVSLALTEAGEEVHTRARQTWRDLQRGKLARLSLDQLRALERIQRVILEEQ